MTRPPLPRTAPLRGFGGVFGHAETPRVDPADAPAGAPAAPPANPVARGVSAGYQVIEQYLRQGQEMARSLWPGSTESTADNKPDPANIRERIIRSASDLAGLFSEFLQTLSLSNGVPAPGSQPPPHFGIPASHRGGDSEAGKQPPSASAPVQSRQPSGPGDHTAVSLDIQSKRRVHVNVNLNPTAWTKRLEVESLRSERGKVSGAPSVSVTGGPVEGTASVMVRVPDRLAVGTYSGLIVDSETNLPQGNISLRIFPPAPKAR